MNSLSRCVGLAVFLAFASLRGALAAAETNTIPLQGDWAFRLDPDKVGVTEKWFDTALPDKTKLPGSTDENGFGIKNTRPANYDYLSRVVEYAGPAWYQREVAIPDAWKGRRITLSLERCHWETRVWVDGKAAGMQDSLCVPHVYDLSALLTPGKHRLTLRVDNTLKYDMGRAAHSTSEQTQSNWNGVIGGIELRATDPVWIEEVQVYPDVARKSVKVRVTVGNATKAKASGPVKVEAVATDSGRSVLSATSTESFDEPQTVIERDFPLEGEVRTWDEFSPALHELKVSLAAKGGEAAARDERRITFGMRNLATTPDKRITLNGRRIFLRGTLECCIFPLTGYPHTEVKDWRRILEVCKSYGLNHMRFHSWCPPEAAFVAADQLGILLHVEAPCWIGNWGRDARRDQWVEDEARRILTAYGNHPSFGMFCMGNEPGGNQSVIHAIVKRLKPADPRHLYLSGSGWGFGPDDDYHVVPIRGLHGPTTDTDFRDADAKHDTPVVSHEIGQWTVYPNLEETRKYTGVLKPRNFELIRDGLKAKHLLDQARDFVLASGKLSVLLYKEEIEVLLRTPGHGGFQLLDLHDFPGQGTALIGTLDPFWDSKGLITPEAYRRFCSPTVPLLRLKKRTFKRDEIFAAQAEIAHFGQTDLVNALPVWTIKDAAGREFASGVFPLATLRTGTLTALGRIEVPLARVEAPAKLTVTVSLKNTDIGNDWELWVYPIKRDVAIPADVVVSKNWDDAAKAALSEGKKVLLLAPRNALANALPGSFTPVFWSPVWFKRGAGTMSILCDPKHPALAKFPTEAWTNWQWYDLLQNSRTMILDDTPPDFRPVVQLIDNFSRNHKLGNLFEARIGTGRLMVCSIDLSNKLEERPAARQLLESIVSYMASGQFDPKQPLEVAAVEKLFGAPPLGKLIEAPKATAAVVLRVKAASEVPAKNTSEPWTAKADRVIAQEKGFGYRVRGGTWRDDTGSAWHSQDDLLVTVTCPKGFTGKLYAHFHDWNELNRVADVFFEGREIGELANYNGPGVWLAFPVTAQDSADGRLELSARPTHANTMITEIVLTK